MTRYLLKAKKSAPQSHAARAAGRSLPAAWGSILSKETLLVKSCTPITQRPAHTQHTDRFTNSAVNQKVADSPIRTPNNASASPQQLKPTSKHPATRFRKIKAA